MFETGVNGGLMLKQLTRDLDCLVHFQCDPLNNAVSMLRTGGLNVKSLPSDKRLVFRELVVNPP